MSFLDNLGNMLTQGTQQNAILNNALQNASSQYNQFKNTQQMQHLYDLARARPDLYGNMYSNAVNAQQGQQELQMKQGVLAQEQSRREQAAKVLQSLGNGTDYKSALSQLAAIDPERYGAAVLDQSSPMAQLDELTKRAQIANIESENKLRDFRSQVLLGQQPTGINPSAPAPMSVRNNNFGNLRNPQTGDFQQYATPEEGKKAMLRDLALKLSGQSPVMQSKYGAGYTPTIENVISTWAPPSENDTQNYIDFVSKQTGIDPFKPLSVVDAERIAPAIAQMEGGQQGAQAYQGAQVAQQQAQDPTEMILRLNAVQSGKTEDIKALNEYLDKKSNPTPLTDAAKLEQDYKKGLISADIYKSQIAKLTKEAQKVTQEADEKQKGQEQLDGILSKMTENLDKLNEKGGIVSEKRGVLSNIGSSLSNTENVMWGVLPSGQGLGRAFGTEEQTLRDRLAADKLRVMSAIQKATGLSSQQLNSNVELQNMLNSIDNPKASYEARKAILQNISDLYGKGSLSKKDSNAEWKIEVIQ